jgi:hypothetical protein
MAKHKITGDPDRLLEPVLFSLRMWTNALAMAKQIEESLTNIVADNLEMYNYELHKHNYHRHDTEKGHSYYDGCITSGNAGKCYLFNNRSHLTLIELLMAEYKDGTDHDENGMVFYYDFCFSYDDPDIPIGLQKAMSSFVMPGFSKRHYLRLDVDVEEEDEAIIWEDEYDIVHIGFEDDGYTPKFVARDKTVQKITWKEYLQSLPQEFFDQRAPLLKAEFRDIR